MSGSLNSISSINDPQRASHKFSYLLAQIFLLANVRDNHEHLRKKRHTPLTTDDRTQGR
jgi:hypothetical protein